MPEPSTINHLVQFKYDREFFVAEFKNGVSHYEIDIVSKTVKLLKKYTYKDLGLPNNELYIVDINLNHYNTTKNIYVLDAQFGIIELPLEGKEKIGKIIVSQRNCEAFDSVESNHYVLLCQLQGYSVIIEAYEYFEKKSNERKYKKIEPIFRANYLNDLHLTEKYYMIYSHKSIHVFWNTKNNKLPETLDTQSELSVPGL